MSINRPLLKYSIGGKLMKATGIVRRIDDLGRIVIPKEIRRVLRIRESDPLEIFTDHEGSIILRKYSPIGDMGSFAKPFAESLAQVSGHIALIADRDQCIAAAGSGKKDYDGKPISRQLEEVINERENFLARTGEQEYIKITLDDAAQHSAQVVTTIICEGDAIGAVILYSKEEKSEVGETEIKLAKVAATFLGRQMEQ